MTSLTDIIAKFEVAFEAFKPIDERPTNLYVTQIYDAIAKIFSPIRYYSVGSRHNLTGMINNDTAYATEYGESFPCLARPCIYLSDIDTTKKASLDSQKKEAVHKARISDWEIYDVAEIKANRFIVRVVTDVWISPLSKGSPTFYVKRKKKDLLDQIQVL